MDSTATPKVTWRNGFQRSFWVANIMELFERLAYYGQAAILSLFLRNQLHFDEAQAGQLSSIFGGLIYMLPIFAGAIADKIGFRKAFSIAFFILAIGYFLIGAAGLPLFNGFFNSIGMYSALSIVFIFTAMGGSFIKPSVLGTVAFTSNDETKSLGYAIYYWLVNIGAAIGPFLAFLMHHAFGLSFVYLISALSCALMFISTLMFYKEPEAKKASGTKSIAKVLTDLVKVLMNPVFMSLLMIYALYWILFWQFFIVIPFYIDDFIMKKAPTELIISIGAWTIILFQIPINRLTKNLATTKAIIWGFALALLCWVMWYFVLPITADVDIAWFGGSTIPLSLVIIGLGIFIFSIGEQIQAPRFYEYIADVAPKGQEALFQGYAFLPIAIAWGFGGTLGGWFYRLYVREGHNPGAMFTAMVLIGLLALCLIVIFARLTSKKKAS